MKISSRLRALARREAAALRAVRESAPRVELARVVRPPYVPQEPTARQKLFLDLREEREVFYGGSAGGGKSSCLLMAALEYVEVPDYSALLLRRTYQDLAKPGALMDRAHQWLGHTAARWNDQKKQWTFPSGAKLTFGNLESENDKYQYQGAEYQFCGWDELSQFTETSYQYLFSRLRKLRGSDIPIRMRSASNPGGVGAEWVYARFIPEDFSPEAARECRVFWKEGADESGRSVRRAFVPATLDDNPHLDRDEYARSLYELDAVTREQLLRGDWHIRQKGNILSMWDERAHVISWSQFASAFGTRHVPDTWLLGVYQDWGTTPEHPCVTSWFATAPQNCPHVNGVNMAGAVFLYRGLVAQDATVREVAGEINRLMAPRGERARVTRWQMSHEASSERIAYQREHKLPFQAWETGKTRGVAQLRNALELTDADHPHPFNSSVSGRPRLYLVVSDDELGYAKTDAGLARHRAEAPAYSWATLRSGEPHTQQVPRALFNDAVDTMRAAAADYFPHSKPLTKEERMEAALPERLRQEQVESVDDPHERWRVLTARLMLFQKMERESARKKRSRNPIDAWRNLGRDRR